MNDIVVGLGEMKAPGAVRDLKDRQLTGPRRHTASDEELRAIGTEVDAHHPVGNQPRLMIPADRRRERPGGIRLPGDEGPVRGERHEA